MAPTGCVKLTFHVTGAAGPSLDYDDEKKTVAIAGRADVKAAISRSATASRTLGVAGELLIISLVTLASDGITQEPS